MEEKNNVPYIVHEGIVTRLERTNERLWILCIILIVLLVGSNCAWIYYESQFEDTVTVQQDVSTDGGGDAVVNNGGDLNYGTGEADGN